MEPPPPDDSEAKGSAPASSGVTRTPAARRILASYWRSNVRVLSVLMVAWAVVGLGCGVLAADWLNRFSLGGYRLGFWFAQQGSIIGFVLIILVYCVLMNRLDVRHHRELEEAGNLATKAGAPREGGRP